MKIFDQSLVDEIYNAFVQPKEYPSLGRREDLATIDQVKVVNLFQKELERQIPAYKDYSAYIPYAMVQEDNEKVNLTHKIQGVAHPGTRYKLPKNYELVNFGSVKVPKIFRRWNKVEVVYGSATALAEKTFMVDEDDVVAFLV